MAPGDAPAGPGHAANVFVLVALVAMLFGAITIIAARDAGFEDVDPGETREVFAYVAPEWDPFGHPMKAVITGPAQFNITAMETTGTGHGESGDFDLEPGAPLTWRAKAQPGEAWSVLVTNTGNETLRVSHSVSCDSYYIVGGILVGVGVLGFISYRLGMRRSDD